MYPSCIDLFAGAGGLSSGFRDAGVHVLASLELNKVYAKTHQANHADGRHVAGSASIITPSEFANTAEIGGEIDLIIGGPPCQTFSNIGKAKINHLRGDDAKADPRNYLFNDYLKYVEYFQPKLFVMENVPQLQTRYSGALFNKLIKITSDLGYEVHISTLNASDYGVPQNRKRLFIVGTKSGVRFNFPESTHGNSGIRKTTVKEALEDLPDIFDGCRLGLLPYKRAARTQFQRDIRSVSGKVSNNVCRMSNERAKRIFSYMRPGDRYMDLPAEVRRILPFREDIFHDRLKRLVPDEQSWTILAHIGMDGYMYIHPWEDRTLSVREAARLQSFPDDYVFEGNMREQYIQVGNAVPPMLAKALARSALAALQ